MGFDAGYECVICYYIPGAQWGPGQRRPICTYCIQRRDYLPNGLLFGLREASSNEICAVCSKKRKLLFRLIVCDQHCGYYTKKSKKSRLQSKAPAQILESKTPAENIDATVDLDEDVLEHVPSISEKSIERQGETQESEGII